MNKHLQSPYFYGLKTKRAEVATNELSALDINASGLETRMPFEHHVGDSVPENNTSSWKSIGELARKLVEQQGGDQ